MKLIILDNLTGEKHPIRKAWIKDGVITNQVMILANPQSEKGGFTSYDMKQISLREKIEEPGKKIWEMKNRYTVEVKSNE